MTVSPTVSTKFTIRRAAAADAEKLLALWQEAADMLAKTDARYKLAPEAAGHWQKDLQRWLGESATAIFVAESTLVEGKLIGFIIGKVIDNLPTFTPTRLGFVSDLVVDPHGKASGIGRGLFDALKGWFREKSVTTVEARVPHRHVVAQAFWRAIGATELYEQMRIKFE